MNPINKKTEIALAIFFYVVLFFMLVTALVEIYF